MAANSIGIPLVMHTDTGSVVYDENVNPNESYAIVIQPEEFKAEDAGKEIKNENVDVNQELHTTEAPVINITPQVGLDDAERCGQHNFIDINPQVSDTHVEASGVGEPIELGLVLPVIDSNKDEKLAEYVEWKVTPAVTVGPLAEPESSDVIMVIKPQVSEHGEVYEVSGEESQVREICEVGGEETDEEEIIDVCSVGPNDEIQLQPETQANISLLRSNSENNRQQRDRFCQVCNKLFEKTADYKRHKVLHNKKKAHYPCKTCPLNFANELGLRIHMRQHFKDNFYPCGFCGKCYTKLFRLQTHLAKKHRKSSGEMVSRAEKGHKHHEHSDTESGCYCTGCGKTLSSKRVLAKHKCKGHFEEKPYTCRVCPRKFKFRNKRDAHITTHEGERNVACVLCGEFFSGVYYRDKHMEQKHPERKWKKCDHCGMVFKNYKFFVRHMRKHRTAADDERHECEQCGAKFRLKEHMALHMAKRHGGPMPRKCEECGEGFVTVLDLSNHTKEKHPETDTSTRSKQGYQCKFCKQTFTKKRRLTKHEKKHNLPQKVKEIKCDFCDLTFVCEIFKNRHIWLKHAGPKPYSCEKCGEGFSNKAKMVKHIKEMHAPQHKMGNETPDASQHKMGNETPDASQHKMGNETPDASNGRSKEKQGSATAYEELKTGGACQESEIETEKLCSEEESNVCPDCGVAFATKLRLMTHTCSNPEHVTQQVCVICLQGFTSQHEYDDHMATHGAEDKFICSMCPKQFNTCFKRDNHTRQVHMKEDKMRWKQCLYCGQTFNNTGYVYGHEKERHTYIAAFMNYKKFKCPLCHDRFELQTMRTHHIMTVHGGS